MKRLTKSDAMILLGLAMFWVSMSVFRTSNLTILFTRLNYLDAFRFVGLALFLVISCVPPLGKTHIGSRPMLLMVGFSGLYIGLNNGYHFVVLFNAWNDTPGFFIGGIMFFYYAFVGLSMAGTAGYMLWMNVQWRQEHK